MSEVDGVRLPFIPIGSVEAPKKPSVHPQSFANSSEFQRIFDNEVVSLKFSAHAKSRIVSRDVGITPDELSKLERAVESAEEKGGRESLVILGEKSFLVSIPNRTVVTVFSNKSMGKNVVTNIDSVVFGG